MVTVRSNKDYFATVLMSSVSRLWNICVFSRRSVTGSCQNHKSNICVGYPSILGRLESAHQGCQEWESLRHLPSCEMLPSAWRGYRLFASNQQRSRVASVGAAFIGPWSGSYESQKALWKWFV